MLPVSQRIPNFEYGDSGNGASAGWQDWMVTILGALGDRELSLDKIAPMYVGRGRNLSGLPDPSAAQPAVEKALETGARSKWAAAYTASHASTSSPTCLNNRRSAGKQRAVRTFSRSHHPLVRGGQASSEIRYGIYPVDLRASTKRAA